MKYKKTGDKIARLFVFGNRMGSVYGWKWS